MNLAPMGQVSFNMEPKQTRSFSSNNQRKDDYQSQFDDLLGKASKKLSKEEQSSIDKEAEARRVEDEEASKAR